jgi:phosphate acetyltransferase
VALAKQHGIHIADLKIADAEHSHASADAAVVLARTGEVEALMKGSLHTDELIGAVVKRDAGQHSRR